MTTVISRVYADKKTASGVLDAVANAGFPANTMDMIEGGDGAEAAILAARVSKAEAAGYAEMLTDGATMAVVRAPVTPFGAAREAMKMMDSAPAKAGSDVYIRERPKENLYLSVLTDHPKFMSSDMNRRNNARRGLLSQAFGWPLLTAQRPRNSAMRGGGFMSSKFWPGALLKSKTSNSAISGGKRMLYNP